MSEATVLVADVTTKEGTGQKGPWKLYNLIDGNQDRYTTFDGALGAKVEALKGKRAAITFEVTEKGNNLKSADEAVEKPASQDGRTYPRDDPTSGINTLIARQNAWAHATALTVAALPEGKLTAKELFEATAPLAHQIELDVRRGFLGEDEIPF